MLNCHRVIRVKVSTGRLRFADSAHRLPVKDMWTISEEKDATYDFVASHQMYGLICAATKGGQISVLDGEFAQLYEYTFPKESVLTHLLWHPTKKMISIARNNGSIIVN